MLTCLEIILGCTTIKQHQCCVKSRIKQKTCYPVWVKCQPIWVSPCSKPAQIQSKLQLGRGLVKENTKLTIPKQQAEKFQGPVPMKCPAPSCGIIINSTSWSFCYGNYITPVFSSPKRADQRFLVIKQAYGYKSADKKEELRTRSVIKDKICSSTSDGNVNISTLVIIT